MRRTESLVSLDISYSGLGMCWLPLDLVDGTDIRWRNTRFETAPKQPMTTASRAILAREVRRFVRTIEGLIGPVRGVWAESLPPLRAHQIIPLAKLHATIEDELLNDLKLELRYANQSSARKLLYGIGRPPMGLTSTQRKAWLFEPLKLAGAPIKNADEGDALCAGNFALSELERPCLTYLLGTPVEKTKKPKPAPVVHPIDYGEEGAAE